MQKYFLATKLAWSNGLVYRTSLMFWRLRQFLASLMALTVWTVVFTDTNSALNYTKDGMITYIFLVAILQNIILATSLHGLADQIYSGQLSAQLLKPINLFGYLITQEVADKLRNFFFIILESIVLFFLFHPVLYLPSLTTWPIFILFVLGGVILHFLIQLLFGSIGFWSNDTWGPRFLFFMFIDFTAGRLFPLDILPKFIQQFVFFTPFPYLSFVQIQIFLEKFNSQQLLQYVFGMGLWIGILSLAAKFLWKKGLKDYTAMGQ